MAIPEYGKVIRVRCLVRDRMHTFYGCLWPSDVGDIVYPAPGFKFCPFIFVADMQWSYKEVL